MQYFTNFGRLLILLGVVLILFGIIVVFFEKTPYLGKLPGDFLIKKGNFTFYFPLTTCLIFSILLTILLRFIVK